MEKSHGEYCPALLSQVSRGWVTAFGPPEVTFQVRKVQRGTSSHPSVQPPRILNGERGESLMNSLPTHTDVKTMDFSQWDISLMKIFCSSFPGAQVVASCLFPEFLPQSPCRSLVFRPALGVLQASFRVIFRKLQS